MRYRKAFRPASAMWRSRDISRTFSWIFPVMPWSYIGELIFNMLILVGAVKMADRLVKEMMGI